MDSIEPIKGPSGRPGRSRSRPKKLHADETYDFPRCRKTLRRIGIKVRISRRAIGSSERSGGHRWVEVGKGEAQVEGRLAEVVDDFVVEQHKPSFVDEDVLGTVVAVRQRVASEESFLDKCVEESGGCRNLPGGISVVRLQPERLEGGAISEDERRLLAALVTPAMDRSQEPSELLHLSPLQPTVQGAWSSSSRAVVVRPPSRGGVSRGPRRQSA